MKKTAVLAALILFACGGLAAFETTKTLSLPAESLQKLEIRAGAGFLEVSGREGLAAIEVKAEIVAKGVSDKDLEAYLKDRIELTLERKGDKAVLVSRVRERFRLFSFGDDAVINLTVSVPKTMPLDIDDGSGSIVIEDVAGARIEDGSGSIRLSRVSGEVEIDDGSGGIEIDDVTGDVSVEDGSGEIDIRRVGGTVTVDDGSGSISIADVAKDVRIVNAGSGGLDIVGVKGRIIRR
jgi:DUF4097 and DUF4098 domain-containing protein YvlB